MKDVSPNRLSLNIKAMVDRSFSTLLKLCMSVHTFLSSETESASTNPKSRRTQSLGELYSVSSFLYVFEFVNGCVDSGSLRRDYKYINI